MGNKKSCKIMSQQYTVIKLKRLSPLHVGTGKENYDFSASDLHSDTLSAALAALMIQQGKGQDVKAFLESFVISSAFPFWKNHYFFPKAQGRMKVSVNGMEVYEYRKELKDVKYVDFSLWKKLMAGEDLEIEHRQIRGEYLFSDYSEEFNGISKSQVNERVSVSRSGDDSDPFFFEWKFFNQEAGLYCLLDTADEGMKARIIDLFVALGETGIGTDKNVGGGKFEVETDSLVFETFSQTNAVMLLSLYIPQCSELEKLDLEHSRYGLLLRDGYMAGSENESFRHLRKKSVYMFDVGSVFPAVIPLAGKIVNLRPKWGSEMHEVYRSGRPFYLPIKCDNYE